ncbi:MAG: hypothetical protein IT444_03680 [Phycisphaeraceae bacterium]|nr:hypothetical protein [Phycisphaeraceae bacterium]
MAERDPQKQPFFHSPLGLILAAFILWALAATASLLIRSGVTLTLKKFPNLDVTFAQIIWTLPVFAISILASVFFLIGVIRWAVYGRTGLPVHGPDEATEETIRVLRAINDRLAVSDTARRILSRDQDRETLRRAIREDIARKDFDTAMVLVNQMNQSFGYRQEAEDFRDEIIHARAAEMAERVKQAIGRFEDMLSHQEWELAAQEAQRIQRLYPEHTQVRELGRRVREARETHKHELERDFLQAAERDDVERAIELLKELDKYLTESEAEPFRETARGVIGKKRQNLGVQFKLAVHDKEWIQAVRVGEQIIREFPNTKMADEVRGLIDLLRERAAGEQAARPREAVK